MRPKSSAFVARFGAASASFWLVAAAAIFLWVASVTAGALQPVPAGAAPGAQLEQPDPAADVPLGDRTVLLDAALRLPAAALLGAALAFRPRRRGTPSRSPAVIQTQILLAVVGALVMMVVGASIARAFGIVGAAGLVRYRAKIEDPKDAGVMLATLGVGLACGVGYYLLGGFATLFFLLLLGVVESLDEGRKRFELTLEGEGATRARGSIEALLQRQGVEFELRSSSDTELQYDVRLPANRKTDRLSSGIQRVAGRDAPLAVRWEERKVK